MVKVYANLVMAGRRSIDEVPSALRAAVEALLGEWGWEPDTPDLSSMTKAELLAYAQEHGVEAYESWTKAEIIAAIEAA